MNFETDSRDENSVVEQIIKDSTFLAQIILTSFAKDEKFLSKMNLAFGESFNFERVVKLRQQWVEENFEELPEIEIRSGEEILGADSAYSIDTNIIYLSREFITQDSINPESIANVLVEEIGHFVDNQINDNDAPGDEGAIFSTLLREENVDYSQIQQLKLEDDKGTITLDGQVIEIEKSSVSDAGGFEGSQKTITLKSNGGGFAEYRYQHFFIPDNFIIRYEGKNILQTGFVGGSKTGRVQIPEGNSDKLEVIVATNNQGTAWNYDVTADSCADTTPLNIELAGGQFEDTDDDGDCDGQGTIYIGRTDGIPRMLRVENATAEYDDKKLTVKGGTVFSEIGGVSSPLFRGDFEIPFSSATTSSLSDDVKNLGGDFKLAGLDVDFNKLSLNRNGIGLGTSFVLPEDVGDITVDSVALGVDTISIAQSGISLGASGKLSLPINPKFSFFKLFDVEASNLSLEYNATEDKLRLQGKFTLDSFLKESFLSKVTADLSGNNFIEIKDDKADIVGSLVVETDIKNKKGWGLSEVKLDIDTINKDVGGSTKLTFPFKQRIPDIELGLGFKTPIPPLEANKVSVNVDNLNLPIPSYPLVFFQNFEGSVDNLAPSDPDPIEFSGGIGATLGPQINNVPGLGTLALIRLDVDGKISSEQLSATGKGSIIADKIANFQGTHTLNWNKKFYETKGNFSLIDDLIQTQNSFKADTTFNINMGGMASANIPNFIPLIGGKNIANGNFVLDFSNDNNLSNDFAAVWSTFQENVFGIDIDVNLGFKGFFDGRLELLSSGLPPTNSFIVSPDTPWILLSADWTNSNENVQVRIKKPDGSFIEEADFSANNIAIFESLTDSDTRAVAVINPTAGIWDIEVVDDSNLGDIDYSGIKASDIPEINIIDPNEDIGGREVTINYEAFDSDSNAEVKLFYDDDNEGFDGILIADNLIENDGISSFIWNTEGVATGDYFIYGMVMDENNAPVFSYSQGKVNISEQADLLVTQNINTESLGAGEYFTYTLNVTNNGSAESKNVTLIETLPEEVTFVSSLSFTPLEKTGNVLKFDLGDLADGESTTIDIIATAPVTEGAITANAFVTSDTFDPDATNDADILTVAVENILPELPDLEVTRTDNTDAVALGDSYTYTLAITNNSSSDATGIILTENLPSGVNLVSTSTDQGFSFYNSFNNAITANVGNLAQGEEATVTVVVNPFAAGNLVSTTEVISNEADADPSNNSLISTKTISPIIPASADLELIQTIDNVNPEVGDQINFNITLTNNGPGIASSIQVTDLLPSELSFVSASTLQGTYDNSTGIWNVGNLRDNLSRTLTITADVVEGGTITNTAEVTAVSEADPDSIPGNNNPVEDDQDTVSFTVKGSGVNEIFGTQGRDKLIGTQNNDIITGFQGVDRITTGDGQDQIIYTSIVDAGDLITDFDPLNDTLDLQGVLQSIGFNGSNAIDDGYVQLVSYGSRGTSLQIDADGTDGSAIFRPYLFLQDVSATFVNDNPNSLTFG